MAQRIVIKRTALADLLTPQRQLHALRRRVPSKRKLAVADRLLFVWLYRLFPSVLGAITMVQGRDRFVSDWAHGQLYAVSSMRFLRAGARAGKSSAICTAWSAAPLRRLSPETNRASPCRTVGSGRTRPT